MDVLRQSRGARIAVLLLPVLVLAVGCSGGTSTRSTAATKPAVPTVPPTRADLTREPAAGGADLGSVRVGFTTVATGFSAPVDAIWRAGDSRMYVVEQGGDVRLVDPSGRPVDPPVLTVPVATGPEQGLFAATFSPDGTKVYADYDDPSGDLRVDEFTMDGDVATGQRTLLTLHEPYPDHNGDQMLFGPDGMLYIGVGDGGRSGAPLGNAQELGTPLGKILRISPAPIGGSPYGVPADNPFVTRAGARPEIWMYGVQNPWRFSFDRDGTMWIGESGQDKYDEIDVARWGHAAGANWGWPLREGRHELLGAAPTRARNPLIELPHPAGSTCSSVVGGYVYRGRAIPALRGAYLHGDVCSPDVVATAVDGGRVGGTTTLGKVRGVVSFGEDPAGELYVVSYTGTVSRIDPAA